MLWFLRGLRRGVVTTRYPVGQLDEWTVTLPSAPVFRASLLTDDLADRLQGVCPSGALRHDPGVLVIDLGACTGCGQCIDAGEGVVEASGQYLLSARRRDDLVKRVRINGTSDRLRSSVVGGGQ